MANKCRSCVYYELQYSHVLKTNVEGCKAPKDISRGDGCTELYKNRYAKPKAHIKGGERK